MTEPTMIAEQVNGMWFMEGEMWLYVFCPLNETIYRNWYEPIEDEL